MAAPAGGHGPAAVRGGARPWQWAALPRRWRGCGWISLVRRLPDSLASAFVPTRAGRDSAIHAGLCPAGKAARVKIGGVHAAVAAFFAAFCRALPPCGLRVGARAWMRYAADPPRAQPRLRSALIPTRYAVGTRLRASFKSAETADFQRRLPVRAFPSRFLGSFRRFGGYEGPLRRHFAQKSVSEGAAGRLQLAPSIFAARKSRGHLLFGGLPARRGLWPAPGTVPTARTRSGLGSGLRPSAAWSLNPLGIINSPRIRSSLHSPDRAA